MIYFTADTHFNHNNVLKYERNQFKTIKEHNDFIMSVIKNTIKDGDVLYHLGDFSMGVELPTDIVKEFKSLPCKKILIAGNHDGAGKDGTIEKHFSGIFDEIYTKPVYYSNRVLLSHEPLPVTAGTLNIHGHLHGAYLDSPNHINVNIHMMDYKLLSEKFLFNKLNQLPKDSTKFMYEWYADKYVFTIEKDYLVFDEDGKVDVMRTRDQLSKRNVNEEG